VNDLLIFANLIKCINATAVKVYVFSALTLFADACSADASDAYEFNKAVNKYLENRSLENQKIVTDFFKKWIAMNTDLILVQMRLNATCFADV
jgi:hypothetical protein